MTTLPPVWFERPVLAEFAASVAARCTILGPATADDPFAGLRTAVAAVVGAAPYGDAAMDRAPGLVVIARTGIGYDAIDVAAATRRGILVCNTPDGPTISTAEHAVTLMLLVAKNVKAAEGALRAGAAIGYYSRHQGIELDGKVLGLVGFGRIARHVARIAAWPRDARHDLRPVPPRVRRARRDRPRGHPRRAAPRSPTSCPFTSR